jgi:hypothetical protein
MLASLLGHYRCAPDFTRMGHIATVLSETTDKQVDILMAEAAGDDYGWPDTDVLGMPQRLAADTSFLPSAVLAQDPRGVIGFRGPYLNHELWWIGNGANSTLGSTLWESASWTLAADHEDGVCIGLPAPDAPRVTLAQRRPIDHWRVHSHSIATAQLQHASLVVPRLHLER